MILQNDCPNLAHLIVLGLGTFALEVDHLFDALATKDVVTPACAFTETQADEKVAKIFESDVGVACAAEHLLRRFLPSRHGTGAYHAPWKPSPRS